MKKSIIIGVICTILFILTAIGVHIGFFKNIDTQIYSFVLRIRTDSLNDIFKTITFMGSSFALIAVPLALIAFNKTRKYGIISAFTLIASYLGNELVKFLIKRPRLTLLPLVAEKSYSFPSGHSMNSLAFYGMLILLILHFSPKNKSTKIISVVLLVLILLIGASRIYLGAHYTSDVIGGFLAGGAILSFAYLVFDKLKIKTVN